MLQTTPLRLKAVWTLAPLPLPKSQSFMNFSLKVLTMWPRESEAVKPKQILDRNRLEIHKLQQHTERSTSVLRPAELHQASQSLGARCKSENRQQPFSHTQLSSRVMEAVCFLKDFQGGTAVQTSREAGLNRTC